MPLPIIYKWANEEGISKEDVEKYWEKAKDITMDAFGYKNIKEFDKNNNRGWKYTMGVIKQMIGKNENSVDDKSILDDFLRSNKSAKEYIEVLVSGQFDIGSIIPPDKKDDEEKIKLCPLCNNKIFTTTDSCPICKEEIM